jgi:trans-2,3-dihydro-3-hydroxyanthranilate isomerase
MRKVPFTQVDVFTSRPFVGNPLAVFWDAEGLTGEQMQLIAREMNLSETTFVLPPTDKKATYRMRIFTPAQELPYAGHPSVGTAFLLARQGRFKTKPPTTRVFQEVPAGVLPLDIETAKDGSITAVWTTQGPPSRTGPRRTGRGAGSARGGVASDPSCPGRLDGPAMADHAFAGRRGARPRGPRPSGIPVAGRLP